MTPAGPNSTNTNNNNDENNRPGISGGGGGDTDEHPAEAETEGYNAENYDSRQARKQSKKRDQSDSFQERLLKAIEAPPPPPEQVSSDSSVKREYIDVAFEAMSFKMKEIFSKEEIMDLVKDLQQLVNRACREKRHHMDIVTNPPLPPQHPLQEQMYAEPPGPMAVPVGNNSEPSYYNFN